MKKIAILTLVVAFGMFAVSCNNQPKEEAVVEEACECCECTECTNECDSCTAECACDSCQNAAEEAAATVAE
ncbi:MAG: hypothetical protein KBT00_05365 [Bacteroidales bacterium]|nr:hypothetical protein [Candidatus Cacconaster merdequi]